MLARIGNTNIFRKKLIILVFVLSLGIIFVGCATAPVTGRSQLILVSQQQAAQLGAQAFQQVLQGEKISHDQRYNSAVRTVGSRIVSVANTPNYNWEYSVIKDDDQINAFALPGGKIGVYTGIIPVAKTHAGLATVLAHEVAHVAANHGAERMSTGMLANLGFSALSAALGGGSSTTSSAILQALGLGVTVGAILPFNRSQESEADRIGLIYMAAAGYDPREAIAFWQRMEAATRGKGRPPEFLSTHPGHGTRINNLQRYLPEALQYYERSNKAPNNRIVFQRLIKQDQKLASIITVK